MQLQNGIAYSSWTQGETQVAPQPMKNLYPERRGKFAGVDIYLPNNVTAYLDTYFGKHRWQEPRWPCDENGNCK